jgi:hypothetical protein
MANHVMLHADGRIEQTYAGNQTDESLTQIVEQTKAYIAQLRQAKQPVHILVDITQLGRLATPTRKVALRALTHIDYDQVAVYGSNPFAKALVNLIAHAAGKSHAVKVFTSRPKAVQWLESHVK